MRGRVLLGAPILALIVLTSCTTDASPPRTTVLGSFPLLRFAGPATCADEPWCLPGLQQVYGIDAAPSFVPLPGTGAGDALDRGVVDVAIVRGDDPRLEADRWMVLDDDRQMVPADPVVPILNSVFAGVNRTTVDFVVQEVSTRLTTVEVARLRATYDQAVLDGLGVDEVAAAWMVEQGLLTNATLGLVSNPDAWVGTTADPTSEVLAHVYARALTAQGLRVGVQVRPGGLDAILDGVGEGTLAMSVVGAAQMLDVADGGQAGASTDADETVALLAARIAPWGAEIGWPTSADLRIRFAIDRQVAVTNAFTNLTGLAQSMQVALPPTTTAEGSDTTGSPDTTAGSGSPDTTAESGSTDTTVPSGEPSLPELPPVDPPDREPPPAPTEGFGVGSEGTRVSAAQDRLREFGLYPAPSNGRYDEAMRRSVAAFQVARGLVPHGVLTDGTWNELQDEADAVESPPSGDPLATEIDGQPVVYLLIARGPAPFATGQMIRALQQADASATFAVTEAALEENPAIARQLITGGQHLAITGLPSAQVNEAGTQRFLGAVERTRLAAQLVAEVDVRCVLPPDGARTADVLAALLDRDLQVLPVDVDTQDWRRPGTDSIVTSAAAAQAGDTLLMHDGGGDRRASVEALPSVLSLLTERGFAVRSIPGCS
jgi:peptidoglycan-N-acetylglucosamine deacetylase